MIVPIANDRVGERAVFQRPVAEAVLDLRPFSASDACSQSQRLHYGIICMVLLRYHVLYVYGCSILI